MRSVVRAGRCTLATALLALAAVSAFGADRNIRTISRYYTKPGQGQEFVDLATKLVEIYKKAGVEHGWSLWQSQTGAPEYTVVRYYAKWAELDQDDPKLKPVEAEIARLTSRISHCVDRIERVADEVLPDQSFGLSTQKEMPKYVRVLVTDVKPDRINDMLEAIKTEVTPAYKKSGAALFLFSRTRFGGPTSQVRSVIGIDGWTAFDGKLPLETVLGDAGYKALLQKLGSMTLNQEAFVYKYIPEGSYVPAGSGT